MTQYAYQRRHKRVRLRRATRMSVEMYSGPRRIGRGLVVDISLGGVGVLLDRMSNANCAECLIRFELPGRPQAIELKCAVAHRRASADGLFWGLKFLDVEEPSHELERCGLRDFLVSQSPHSSNIAAAS